MAFDKFPFPKDPSEKLAYGFNFAGLVGDEDVSLPTVRCEIPAGMTGNALDIEISNVVLSGKAVHCLVDGGVAGVNYGLVFGLTFGDAEENFERTVILQVRNR